MQPSVLTQRRSFTNPLGFQSLETLIYYYLTTPLVAINPVPTSDRAYGCECVLPRDSCIARLSAHSRYRAPNRRRLLNRRRVLNRRREEAPAESEAVALPRA